MNRIIKALYVMLCLVLVIGTISPAVAQGATKPELARTSVSISLGTQSYEDIIVYERIKGAKYIYTSTNKKIVTVNSEGTLTGVGYGTAKINVTQILKKKTTTIGSCKVTVKKSKLFTEEEYILELGKDAFTNGDHTLANWNIIEYGVPSATYTFYSNDSSRLIVKKDGTVVETKKAGKVSFTVKETYKRKTRTVGKYTFEVKAPEFAVENNVKDIAIGQYVDIFGCCRYYSGPLYVECIDGDKDDTNDALSFVKDEDGMWDGFLKGEKEGTMTVSIYLGKEKADNNLLGTFTVNIKKYTATEITLDSDKISFDIGDEYDWIYFGVEPYNCTETAVISSSDPSIVSIEVNEDELKDGSFKVIFNKIGTATITIKVGSITKQLIITVTDSDEE